MLTTDATRRYLVADIGGTNTRVALTDGPRVIAGSIRTYKNASKAGIAAILGHFLAEHGNPECAGCCLAAAGPLQGGRITMINLGWTIDPAEITSATGIKKVALLNDLQALGHAVDHLSDVAQLPLIKGPAVNPSGVKLVIGVGTGFNAAAIHETKGGRLVTSSECGHTSLPISSKADLELGRFCTRSADFTSVEDILSGRGLEKIYDWLGRAGDTPPKSGREITAALALGNDPQALAAAHIFTRFLGTVAGDLALTHLPYGGIFIAGGVARALAPHLEPLGFTQAFHKKGRFAAHMQSYDVSVIHDDFAALTGCAAFLQSDPKS